MEDGSALTPLIANSIQQNVQPTMNNNNNFQQQKLFNNQAINSIQSPAIKHLRLLAKLCDCPVYLNSSYVTSQTNQQQNGNQEETKLNSLMLDCLRQKSVEQIMQRTPIEFIHLDHSTGDLLISANLLNRLKTLQASSNISSISSSSSRSSSINLTQTMVADSSIDRIDSIGHDLVSVHPKELNELFSNLQTQLALKANNNKSNRDNSSFIIDDHELFDQLFKMIILQKEINYNNFDSNSIGPVFGPLLDGSVIVDEDLAVGMMKKSSSFSQKDLLIGLSKSPILPHWTKKRRKEDNKNDDDDLNDDRKLLLLLSSQQLNLGPEHLLSDKILAKMELNGFSNEQAIELINLFVRSFYRYHNQEITNSIINHYLGSLSMDQRRLGLLKTKTNKKTSRIVEDRHVYFGDDNLLLRRKLLLEDEDDANVNVNDDESLVAGNKNQPIINEQQLFIFEALLEAFQDALVNVPVLRTALIHATRQLDSLIEVFIGQEFELWLQQQNHLSWLQLDGRFKSFTKRLTTRMSNDSNLQLSFRYDQFRLLEKFSQFANTLFTDPNWPLELHNFKSQQQQQNSTIDNNNSSLQPKSTYLYQFDPSLLIEQLNELINRLKLNNFHNFEHTTKLIKILNSLLNFIRSLEFQRRFSGFGCLLDQQDNSQIYDWWSNNNNTNTNSSSELESTKLGYKLLIDNFSQWLCSQIGRTLANFVATGNVNRNYNNNDDPTTLFKLNIDDELAIYSIECSTNKSHFTTDHHSVQAIPINSSSSSTNNQTLNNDNDNSFNDCNLKLFKLASNYVINELSTTTTDTKLNTNWPVFNLFSQKVATLPSGLGINSKSNSNYQVDFIDSLDYFSNYDQKSTFSGRSLFWLNFIPALNCSRTQPINPISLLSSRPLNNHHQHSSINDSQVGQDQATKAAPSSTELLNSTLLNSNLIFSCLKGGTIRTALDSIESDLSFIKSQLQARIQFWLESKDKDGNHHSLRMANVSQSELETTFEQQQREENSPLSDLQSKLNSITESSLIGTTIVGDNNNNNNNNNNDEQLVRKAFLDQRAKYAKIVLIALGLLISLTLISGALASLLNQRKKIKRRAKVKQEMDGNKQDNNDKQQQINANNNDLTANGFESNYNHHHHQQQQSSSFIMNHPDHDHISHAKLEILNDESIDNPNQLISNVESSNLMTMANPYYADQPLNQQQQQSNIYSIKINSLDKSSQFMEEEETNLFPTHVNWNYSTFLADNNNNNIGGPNAAQCHSSLSFANNNNFSELISEGVRRRQEQFGTLKLNDGTMIDRLANGIDHEQHRILTTTPSTSSLLNGNSTSSNQHYNQHHHPMYLSERPQSGCGNLLNYSMSCNGGLNYGGSSSETNTQNQSSVCSSSTTATATTKKRVKISDPRDGINDDLINQFNDDSRVSTLTKLNSTKQNGARNYCPVHQPCDQVALEDHRKVGFNVGYIVENNFLAANNLIGITWADEVVNDDVVVNDYGNNNVDNDNGDFNNQQFDQFNQTNGGQLIREQGGHLTRLISEDDQSSEQVKLIHPGGHSLDRYGQVIGNLQQRNSSNFNKTMGHTKRRRDNNNNNNNNRS